MAYVEPCCCDRQLPQLIRESKSGFTFFQTSGDVTVEKLVGATASLAEGRDGHVMLLALPEVDDALIRMLQTWLRRGWTKALLLISQTDGSELIRRELGQWLDRIHYAADPLILDALCMVVGLSADGQAATKALILQGPMLTAQDFSLCQYVAYLGRDAGTIRQATDPLIAKLKTKPIIDRSDHRIIGRLLQREPF